MAKWHIFNAVATSTSVCKDSDSAGYFPTGKKSHCQLRQLSTQHISCIMIPLLNRVFGTLPVGIHAATWNEIEVTFGNSPKRKILLEGLKRACLALRAAGVAHLYLDGSFVTAKRNPSDWDACYSGDGVDSSKMDSVLLDFSNERAAQKAKYLGEAFIAEMAATTLGQPYLDFFQTERITGRKKGIVCVDLGTII